MMARRGVTLIELLVALSIVALLVAILLPAVHASRESGRRTQCANNLRQVALALSLHESAQGRLPSGGWGYEWYGDPDRGTGPRQPGGWIYAILSYLERPDLARLGSGEPPLRKMAAAGMLNQVSLAVMHCPSRRPPGVYPFDTGFPPRNAHVAALVAKTDFAGNGGDFVMRIQPGPPSLEAGDDPKYNWPSTRQVNGLFFVRSAVRRADVTDGTSYTYLVGEKYVSESWPDLGDDQAMYCGFGYDIVRWTSLDYPPRRDGLEQAPRAFGSAHAEVCQFALYDGSLRTIRFTIDPELHRRLGNRSDGETVPDSAFVR